MWPGLDPCSFILRTAHLELQQQCLVFPLQHQPGLSHQVQELRANSESQSGRGWKGPLEVTWCHPLLKQGPLEPAAQDHVRQLSKDGDSTACWGNPCQCLVTFKVKNHFLMLRENFFCFSLCPLPLVSLIPASN